MDIQVYDSMKYLVAESTSRFGAVYLAKKPPYSVREHLIGESYIVDMLYDIDAHDQWFLFNDWSQDWYMVDNDAGRCVFVAEWRNK